MVRPSPPTVPPGVVQSWQQVHHLLVQPARDGATLAEVAALGSYYYHLYQAFGQPSDAAAAQHLLADLVGRLTQQPPTPSDADVAYACAAAWLGQHLAAAGLEEPLAAARLTNLDQVLLQLAGRAPGQPGALGRQAFFRLVRYFDLRRPGPLALAALQQLLAGPLPPAFGPGGAPSHPPQSLDLADGLASELLIVGRLAKAGIADQPLQQHLREGVRGLLALKQDLDFAGRHYALFPYQAGAGAHESAFSSELSWHRGDLGQALVLYTASELFADAELAGLARLVGLNTLLRTSSATTGVGGATVGRGAAGLGQLYHRLYTADNQLPQYYQGYLFWVAETQRWLRHELATGFYQSREASLTNGLPGVGLLLLAAATGTGHAWDDLLL